MLFPLLDFLEDENEDTEDFLLPVKEDDDDFLRPNSPSRSFGLLVVELVDVEVEVEGVDEEEMGKSRTVDSIDQRDLNTGD